MTRINPAAYVQLGGVKLAATESPGVPVVLAGVHASWGRADVLQNPAPGTGEFSVYDPTGLWGTGVDFKDATDWLNDTCDFGWTWAGTDRVFFRGTVTGIDVAPFRGGALLTFAVTSRMSVLGSARNGTAYPEEDLAARTSRLSTALPGYGSGAFASVTAVTTVPGATNNLRDTPALDRTMLENLADIYDATGATFAYLPDPKTVSGVTRRSFPGVRGLAGLVRDTTGDRTGKGAYIAANAAAGQTRRLFLDGAETQPSGGAWLTRAAEQAPTQFDVKFWQRTSTTAQTYAEAVASYSPTWRRVKGNTRAVEMETRYLGAGVAGDTRTGAAGVIAAALGAAVTQEAGAWRPEPVTLTFSIGGGAETLDQALVLLAGGEYPDLFFVQRSLYPQLGIRPVFGVMGGEITRAEGADGWLLTLNLAPVHTDTKQHPVTWAEIDDGTTGNTLKVYLDGADHADGLHESVTVEDLAYCATGLGVTTPGPDTGWDTLQ